MARDEGVGKSSEAEDRPSGATAPVLRARPSLGFWRSWSLVVGSVVGSGVFLMPTVLAPYGGVGVVSVVAAGLGGLCIATVFANLSRRVSGSGGPYAYAHAGFGDFAGFLVAWVYWAALWSAGGAIATAIPGYLGVLFPDIAGRSFIALVVTLLAVWSSVAINWLGIKEAGIVGLITTLGKLVPLTAVGVAGLFLMDRRIFPPFNPGAGPPIAALLTSFTIAFFSYVGIESATVPAEDVVDPRATIPRATILGTLTAIGLYVLVTVAAMGAIPTPELAASSAPLAMVGERIAGRAGSVVVAAGALLTIYSAMHYAIMLAGQIPMVAARDGLFPRVFALQTGRGTPGVALVATGVLGTCLIIMNSSKSLVGAYTFINLMSTLATVVPYAFCAAAALLIRSTDVEPPGARVRSKVIAVIAFGVAFLVIAGAGSDAVYWFTLLLLAGLPVYVGIRRVSDPVNLRRT
jgi:APA family basic amino acid/polyamine antiporter